MHRFARAGLAKAKYRTLRVRLARKTTGIGARHDAVDGVAYVASTAQACAGRRIMQAAARRRRTDSAVFILRAFARPVAGARRAAAAHICAIVRRRHAAADRPAEPVLPQAFCCVGARPACARAGLVATNAVDTKAAQTIIGRPAGGADGASRAMVGPAINAFLVAVLRAVVTNKKTPASVRPDSASLEIAADGGAAADVWFPGASARLGRFALVVVYASCAMSSNVTREAVPAERALSEQCIRRDAHYACVFGAVVGVVFDIVVVVDKHSRAGSITNNNLAIARRLERQERALGFGVLCAMALGLADRLHTRVFGFSAICVHQTLYARPNPIAFDAAVGAACLIRRPRQIGGLSVKTKLFITIGRCCYDIGVVRLDDCFAVSTSAHATIAHDLRPEVHLVKRPIVAGALHAFRDNTLVFARLTIGDRFACALGERQIINAVDGAARPKAEANAEERNEEARMRSFHWHTPLPSHDLGAGQVPESV